MRGSVRNSHARGGHPRAGGAEVLDMEEETHPAGRLAADDGGLIVPVGLG